MPNQQIQEQIQEIFNNNIVDDLKKFLSKRKCLNLTNSFLIYLFHAVQMSGILITAIAAGYDMKSLIWLGVGLNSIATLIQIFEKNNNTMSDKIFKDIMLIKNGTYIDESNYVDIESSGSVSNSTPNSTPNPTSNPTSNPIL